MNESSPTSRSAPFRLDQARSDFVTCVRSAWLCAVEIIDGAHSAEKLTGFCFIQLYKPREQGHCIEHRERLI